MLNRTSFCIFKSCFRSQTYANIHEVFQNICHVVSLYILHSVMGSYFSQLTHVLLFRWYLVICHMITNIQCDILTFFEQFGKITSQKRQILIALIFVNMIQYPGILKNNMDHLSKLGPPTFFHLVSILYLETFWSILSKKSMFWLYSGISLVVVIEQTSTIFKR